MGTQRTGDPISDDALDREIEQALAVEPSPEFLARVRTRIASDPVASGWSLSWGVVGASAFATAVVLALAITRVGYPPAPAPPAGPVVATPIPESAPTVATNATVASPPAPPAPPALAGQSTARVHVRQAALPAAAEVLISPRDAIALRALVLNIHEGRVDPTVLSAFQGAVTSLEPFDTIAIQPIASEPIPPLALLEGAFQ